MTDPFKLNINIERKPFQNFESVIDRNLHHNTVKASEKTESWKKENHFRKADGLVYCCASCVHFNFVKCKVLYDFGGYSETMVENLCDKWEQQMRPELLMENQAARVYCRMGADSEVSILLTLDTRNGGFKLVCPHFDGGAFSTKKYSLMMEHIRDHRKMKHAVSQQGKMDLMDDWQKFNDDADRWKP